MKTFSFFHDISKKTWWGVLGIILFSIFYFFFRFILPTLISISEVPQWFIWSFYIIAWLFSFLTPVGIALVLFGYLAKKYKMTQIKTKDCILLGVCCIIPHVLVTISLWLWIFFALL